MNETQKKKGPSPSHRDYHQQQRRRRPPQRNADNTCTQKCPNTIQNISTFDINSSNLTWWKPSPGFFNVAGTSSRRKNVVFAGNRPPPPEIAAGKNVPDPIFILLNSRNLIGRCMSLTAAVIDLPADAAVACGYRSSLPPIELVTVAVVALTRVTSRLRVYIGAYSCNGLGAKWIGCGAVVVWSAAVEPELTVMSLRLEHWKRGRGLKARILDKLVCYV
ncbi:hypothetical protein PIB30_070165 [Stylosanthes scabra]|uniref:Uncharacterized protein n=1 Tax=Stylosanthes scabra TaxID=79078 RepID=A0ABU6TNK4_9FABA|nr:hypothetical protein [Stylosanthes scabra]